MPGSGKGLRRARKTDHSEGYRGLEIHATTSPARTRQQPAWAHMQLTDRTTVAKVPLTGLSSVRIEKLETNSVTADGINQISVMPQRYCKAATSGLTATVTEDGKTKLLFEVTGLRVEVRR